MSDFFKTGDICLASYLYVRGMVLNDITPTATTRMLFEFVDCPERELYVKEFRVGRSLPIAPIDLFSAEKGLKARLRILTENDPD